MSEEEKEAIEEAKKQIEEAHNLNDINVFMTDSTTLKILLNYIEKLQKENTELKEENKKLKYEIEGRNCVIETQRHNEDVILDAMAKKDKVMDLMAEKIWQQIIIAKNGL